jgi:hypothetical protein
MFKYTEIENVFEIGRIIQVLVDKGEIKGYGRKVAFIDAVNWAMEFEEKYADTEDFYLDIWVFVRDKLKEKGLLNEI